MKTKIFIFILTLSLLSATKTIASESDLTVSGKVKVTNPDVTEIIDPEEPTDIINPETTVSTKGNLRFDRLPDIDFGNVSITKKNRSFHALAEKIKQGSRGSFLQISDFREKSTGWVIQVKQDYQFRTTDYDELTGAVLSVDKGWANSTSTSGKPIVTRNILEINNIGEAYEVARAGKNEGQGVWSISFGSSGDNDDGQSTTLSDEKIDKNLKNKTDTTKAVGDNLKNTAVTLNIPDGTPIVPKEYQTKFTWNITAAP